MGLKVLHIFVFFAVYLGMDYYKSKPVVVQGRVARQEEDDGVPGWASPPSPFPELV